MRNFLFYFYTRLQCSVHKKKCYVAVDCAHYICAIFTHYNKSFLYGRETKDNGFQNS